MAARGGGVSFSNGDVPRHLRRLAGGREAPDEVLLARVAERADPEAFEALVCRHGGLVVGTCRRQLREPHDVSAASGWLA